MNTKEKIEIAIHKITEQQNDLKRIEELKIGTVNEALDFIDRWYLRCRKTIDDYVSNVEAKNFKERSNLSLLITDNYGLLKDKIQFYNSKLNVLIAELQMNPESIIDPSKLEVSDSGLIKNDPVFKLLHIEISTVSKKQFEDGYYAESVFTAFKYVNNKVKKKYKSIHGEELDGKNLMMNAFSDRNPVFEMGDLSTETGKNMQEGYRFIFAGAMQAIRNPKAHELIQIDKIRAIHFLFLASLQLHKLDESSHQ